VIPFFLFGRCARLDDRGAPARRTDARREAEERAEELLRSWLSPVQRRQYDAQACFEVVGSDTGKPYRICKGRVYNIQELDPYGVQVRAWYFMADGIATGDVNLAQKIALEAFETKVLAIANGSEGAVWPPVIRP
jgi:hypothetical protein